MGYVFLSYARIDASALRPLIEAVEAAGYLLWIDERPESIRGGALWRKEIVEAIRNADALLIALSPRSVESDDVRRELDIATEMPIPVIPVEIEATTLPAGLQYQLAGQQRIDLTAGLEAGLARVLDALRNARPLGTLASTELSVEARHRIQQVLHDEGLSVQEKTARFMSAFEAEAAKRREAWSAQWDERAAREQAVWDQLRETRARIQDLEVELAALRRAIVPPRRTIDLLERELGELKALRKLLEREQTALSRQGREDLARTVDELQQTQERMRQQAEKARADGDRLIRKVFGGDEPPASG